MFLGVALEEGPANLSKQARTANGRFCIDDETTLGQSQKIVKICRGYFERSVRLLLGSDRPRTSINT